MYKLTKNGEPILLTDSITRPNGLAFFPDGKKLLVASSDPHAANWYVVNTDEPMASLTLFYSVTAQRDGLKGLPDGLKIDKNGNVFASGPGGLWIFNRDGNVLGKIKFDEVASNVSLSADETTLYITNNRQVLRMRLR